MESSWCKLIKYFDLVAVGCFLALLSIGRPTTMPGSTARRNFKNKGRLKRLLDFAGRRNLLKIQVTSGIVLNGSFECWNFQEETRLRPAIRILYRCILNLQELISLKCNIWVIPISNPLKYGYLRVKYGLPYRVNIQKLSVSIAMGLYLSSQSLCGFALGSDFSSSILVILPRTTAIVECLLGMIVSRLALIVVYD
ncbi:hypothetical protein HAX54_010298 [Datura stramonium]|uniref:Uncharacterized protein n=1 Tax=Datura stramonium TaxID=4076 RepID=A0ABS8TG16_DATST|nr:hypothetical protein [Datura stramonium]